MTNSETTRATRPTVLLHVGEPKTATTFVQQVMHANSAALGEQGVRVVGASQYEIFRATQDLRDIVRRDDDPGAPWTGEWNQLARDALRTDRMSVISHELLCAATDAQIARAVASLRGADVHVLVTVRDMASLLPAEWQESVKHRTTRAWDDWLADVIDKEFVESSEAGGAAADHPDSWFWLVHDTAALLERWARHVPRANVHVLTVPPSGSDRSLVWRRFAEVLDVPADGVDLDVARSNQSLGLSEVELLRRFNTRLSPEVPGWFYMTNVKEPLAHGVLAGRPGSGRLQLPAERMAWANEYAETLISRLAEAGYPVHGDLADLRPAQTSGAGRHPATVTDEEMLDAAVAAVAEQLVRRYRRVTQQRTAHVTPGTVLLGTLRRAPRLRARLYALSESNAVLGTARRQVRRAIEHSRDRRDATVSPGARR